MNKSHTGASDEAEAVLASPSGSWWTNFKIAGVVLFGLTAVQSFHMTEHALLFIQYYVEGLRRPTAILELIFNDTIPVVHFWFNLLIWTTILLILYFYVRAKYGNRSALADADANPQGRGKIRAFELILFAGVLFQSIHMVDHIIQIYQFSVLGMASPKGLFGQFIDEKNIVIHLYLNGGLLVGLVVASICFTRLKSCILQLGSVFPILRAVQEAADDALLSDNNKQGSTDQGTHGSAQTPSRRYLRSAGGREMTSLGFMRTHEFGHPVQEVKKE